MQGLCNKFLWLSYFLYTWRCWIENSLNTILSPYSILPYLLFLTKSIHLTLDPQWIVLKSMHTTFGQLCHKDEGGKWYPSCLLDWIRFPKVRKPWCKLGWISIDTWCKMVNLMVVTSPNIFCTSMKWRWYEEESFTYWRSFHFTR